jgi:hypothetical protein
MEWSVGKMGCESLGKASNVANSAGKIKEFGLGHDHEEALGFPPGPL